MIKIEYIIRYIISLETMDKESKAKDRKENKAKENKAKFIERANEVHNGKYIYPDTMVYINARTNVEIVCPEHGIFNQSPTNHFRSGCDSCAKNKEFIERCKEVHEDKYDYSNVEYTNRDTRVEIICPTHGSFWQSIRNHLKFGCKKCAKHKEFIERSKEVHEDKYDYSKVQYENSNIKVEIICPIHASFWQVPRSHLAKNGCSKCSGTYSPTTEEFIEKAKEIHGNKYDYSKVEYKGYNDKIEIICPIHDPFFQTPIVHLRSSGCNKCSGTYSPTTEEFIEKSKEIHGNKYDYSKVYYENNCTKVEIICPIHGPFFQTPSNHLLKCGCLKCSGTYSPTTEEFIEKAKEIHGNSMITQKWNIKIIILK
jgi:hypothetical protein